jgi:BirA family transcriptional regulator, biotin operon repressor / biotin---[acetyl-CoA-carboxylase] ligase
MERGLDALRPATRWVGHPLEYLAEVDSTNRVAQERARAGAPEGTVVLADQQSAGRGRLGRSFFSPPGVSVYLSLVLRPDVPAERLHEHVFAASLAVAHVCAGELAAERIAIKWPNDVLIDGRKTSGINAPAQLAGGRAEFLVLGVGVNVNTPASAFPHELAATATSLRIARGAPLDRAAFTERLLAQLEREIDAMRAQGFASLLDRWRGYFRMRGSRVRIDASGASGPEADGPGAPLDRADREARHREAREASHREANHREANHREANHREGIVENVDRDGALILRVAHGGRTALERVVAGDVSLLEPLTPSTPSEPF